MIDDRTPEDILECASAVESLLFELDLPPCETCGQLDRRYEDEEECWYALLVEMYEDADR